MSSPYSILDEQRILQLLREERGYYRLILNLEGQENAGLTNSPLPLDRFRSFQRKKKGLISCIQEVEVELEPMKRLWKQLENHNSFTSREIEEELDDLDELLREILNLAERNRVLVERSISLSRQNNTFKETR